MHTPETDRDPVAVSIEEFLNEESQHGGGPLHTAEDDEGVSVTFDGATAQAPSYDLALVRLATVLFDDERYCEALVSRLQEFSAKAA
jgi:hypothetical protein